MRTLSHACLVAALWWPACTPRLDDPERFRVDPDRCASVEALVLAQRCGNAACHESSKPAAELDLVSPGVERRLVGQRSEQCRELLIDPGAVERSLLLLKLGADVACGSRMPLSRELLTDDEQACLVSWIRRVSSGADSDAGSDVSTVGEPLDSGSSDGAADAD